MTADQRNMKQPQKQKRRNGFFRRPASLLVAAVLLVAVCFTTFLWPGVEAATANVPSTTSAPSIQKGSSRVFVKNPNATGGVYFAFGEGGIASSGTFNSTLNYNFDKSNSILQLSGSFTTSSTTDGGNGQSDTYACLYIIGDLIIELVGDTTIEYGAVALAHDKAAIACSGNLIIRSQAGTNHTLTLNVGENSTSGGSVTVDGVVMHKSCAAILMDNDNYSAGGTSASATDQTLYICDGVTVNATGGKAQGGSQSYGVDARNAKVVVTGTGSSLTATAGNNEGSGGANDPRYSCGIFSTGANASVAAVNGGKLTAKAGQMYNTQGAGYGCGIYTIGENAGILVDNATLEANSNNHMQSGGGGSYACGIYTSGANATVTAQNKGVLNTEGGQLVYQCSSVSYSCGIYTTGASASVTATSGATLQANGNSVGIYQQRNGSGQSTGIYVGNAGASADGAGTKFIAKGKNINNSSAGYETNGLKLENGVTHFTVSGGATAVLAGGKNDGNFISNGIFHKNAGVSVTGGSALYVYSGAESITQNNDGTYTAAIAGNSGSDVFNASIAMRINGALTVEASTVTAIAGKSGDKIENVASNAALLYESKDSANKCYPFTITKGSVVTLETKDNGSDSIVAQNLGQITITDSTLNVKAGSSTKGDSIGIHGPRTDHSGVHITGASKLNLQSGTSSKPNPNAEDFGISTPWYIDDAVNTVNVQDTSTVIAQAGDAPASYGMYLFGHLKVSGHASVTSTSGNASFHESIGLYMPAYPLVVSDYASVYATAGTGASSSAGKSFGVSSAQVELTGGFVYAAASTTEQKGLSAGINVGETRTGVNNADDYLARNIYISGNSRLIAVGGHEYGRSYGIYRNNAATSGKGTYTAEDDFLVTGGHVTLRGQTAAIGSTGNTLPTSLSMPPLYEMYGNNSYQSKGDTVDVTSGASGGSYTHDGNCWIELQPIGLPVSGATELTSPDGYSKVYGVNYFDENGEVQTCFVARAFNQAEGSNFDVGGAGAQSWYATSNKSFGNLNCAGDVRLILLPGTTFDTDGMPFNNGGSLTVYLEATSTTNPGKVIANAASGTALGGANATITTYGGYITAISGDKSKGINGSSITMNNTILKTTEVESKVTMGANTVLFEEIEGKYRGVLYPEAGEYPLKDEVPALGSLTNMTLQQDLTLDSNMVLTVGYFQNLTIASGVSFTNNGIICLNRYAAINGVYNPVSNYGTVYYEIYDQDVATYADIGEDNAVLVNYTTITGGTKLKNIYGIPASTVTLKPKADIYIQYNVRYGGKDAVNNPLSLSSVGNSKNFQFVMPSACVHLDDSRVDNFTSGDITLKPGEVYNDQNTAGQSTLNIHNHQDFTAHLKPSYFYSEVKFVIQENLPEGTKLILIDYAEPVGNQVYYYTVTGTETASIPVSAFKHMGTDADLSQTVTTVKVAPTLQLCVDLPAGMAARTVEVVMMDDTAPVSKSVTVTAYPAANVSLNLNGDDPGEINGTVTVNNLTATGTNVLAVELSVDIPSYSQVTLDGADPVDISGNRAFFSGLKTGAHTLQITGLAKGTYNVKVYVCESTAEPAYPMAEAYGTAAQSVTIAEDPETDAVGVTLNGCDHVIETSVSGDKISLTVNTFGAGPFSYELQCKTSGAYEESVYTSVDKATKSAMLSVNGMNFTINPPSTPSTATYRLVLTYGSDTYYFYFLVVD